MAGTVTPTTTHNPNVGPSVASNVPNVPSNGYATGLVRYVRSLKATGHAVSCYRTSGTTTGLTPAYLRTLGKAMPAACKAAPFAWHCHVCNVWGAGTSWATTYAASMAHGSLALAPSVAASLGKAGLAAVGVPGVYVRPAGGVPTATPPTAPIAVPAPLALGAGPVA